MKSRFLRVGVPALAITLFLSAFHAPAGEKFVLTAGHVLSANSHFQAGFEFIARELDKRTNGAVTLQIFPGAQLGADRDMIEGAQLGTIDIICGVNTSVTDFEPSFFIWDLPYLFDSREQAFAILDSELGQRKLKNLEKVGIIGVGYWATGMFYIVNNQKEIKTIEDMAGMTIRVMETPIYMRALESVGASPVPMAVTEVMTSLQNHTIAGATAPAITIGDQEWYAPAPYFLNLPYAYSPFTVSVSKMTYDRLPPEYQKIVLEVLRESCQYERDAQKMLEEKNFEKMRAAGVIFTTPDDIQVFKDKMRESWKLFIPNEVDPEELAAIEELKKTLKY